MATIRPVDESDAPAIADLYNYYIKETTHTFEESPVSVAEIIKRIKKVEAYGLPWLIVEDNNQLIGYSYAKKFKERSAYRFAVESTVYVSDHHVMKGWGTKLYEALFAELKHQEIYVVIGGITLPNPASIKLHEKMGMEKIAHFKQVGYKFEQRLDVGYWQLILKDLDS